MHAISGDKVPASLADIEIILPIFDQDSFTQNDTEFQFYQKDFEARLSFAS